MRLLISEAAHDADYIAARIEAERGRTVDPRDPPAVAVDPAIGREEHLTNMVCDHWGLPEPTKGKRDAWEGNRNTDEGKLALIERFVVNYKARHRRRPCVTEISRSTHILAADVRRLIKC